MALYDAALLPWPPLPARAPGKAARISSRRELGRALPQPPEALRWAAELWALLRSRKVGALGPGLVWEHGPACSSVCAGVMCSASRMLRGCTQGSMHWHAQGETYGVASPTLTAMRCVAARCSVWRRAWRPWRATCACAPCWPWTSLCGPSARCGASTGLEHALQGLAMLAMLASSCTLFSRAKSHHGPGELDCIGQMSSRLWILLCVGGLAKGCARVWRCPSQRHLPP